MGWINLKLKKCSAPKSRKYLFLTELSFYICQMSCVSLGVTGEATKLPWGKEAETKRRLSPRHL